MQSGTVYNDNNKISDFSLPAVTRCWVSASRAIDVSALIRVMEKRSVDDKVDEGNAVAFAIPRVIVASNEKVNYINWAIGYLETSTACVSAI